MNRLTSVLTAAVLLAGCTTAQAPSAEAVPTDPPIRLPTAPPAPEATSTPAPTVHHLSLYPLPQANDLFRGAHVASMAGGRAGVVMLGSDQKTGALISWTSADGRNWTRNWLPGATFGGGSPEWLVGGDFGYLALGWNLAARGLERALWSSRDGVGWEATATIGLPTTGLTAMIAGPAGILLEIEGSEGPSALAVSLDGRNWQTGSVPTGVPNASGMVALPHGFAVSGSTEGLDSAGGTIEKSTVWRSTNGLAWTVDEALGHDLVALPDSIVGWTLSPYGAIGWDIGGGLHRVTESGLERFERPPTANGYLVGSPSGLLWVEGTSLDGSCVAAWQFDGLLWAPLDNAEALAPCIDPVAPYVIGAAPLADGAVAFGLLGQDYQRVAWVIGPAGVAPSGSVAGGPVPAAPAASIPDPLAIAFDHLSLCPPKPATIDDTVALDPWLGAGCFGHEDIAFKAWVVDPGEGYGGTCETFNPTWIHECVLPDYLLSSGAGVDLSAVGAAELHAMRSPSATGDLAGVGRWVQVTGHFNDPVSPSCRYYSYDAGVNFGFESVRPAAMAVLQCRLVFVVTHLRTVPAG